jgi:hypothetical protein
MDVAVPEDLGPLREELAESFTCRVDDLWSSALADELEREARDGWGSATPSFSAGYRAFDDGSLGGPIVQYWSDAGSTLTELHQSPELCSLASGLAGGPAAPVRAAYLYYRTGGFCGIHRDRAEFELQLLVHLAGPMGPLIVHPDLAPMSSVELARRCQADAHVGAGQPVRYPRLGVTAFRGSAVPHERPPHAGPELAIVVGLNYRRAR